MGCWPCGEITGHRAQAVFVAGVDLADITCPCCKYGGSSFLIPEGGVSQNSIVPAVVFWLLTFLIVAMQQLLWQAGSGSVPVQGWPPGPVECLLFQSLHKDLIAYIKGLPWWLSKNRLQRRRPRFHPWVRKIPWRREWYQREWFLFTAVEHSLIGWVNRTERIWCQLNAERKDGGGSEKKRGGNCFQGF